MKAPLEKDIQRQCLDYLTLCCGFLAWRQNSGGAYYSVSGGRRQFVRFSTAEGAGDLLGVLPGGRFLSAEIKRPGNKPTPMQLGWAERVRAAGGLALVVTSVGELRDALRAEGYDVP